MPKTIRISRNKFVSIYFFNRETDKRNIKAAKNVLDQSFNGSPIFILFLT